MILIKEIDQMNEIVVKKSNFDKALAKIEKASKDNKQVTELQRFEEKGGLFSLFPKKVTGQEMNEFSSQLQSNLINLNDKINKAYKQFIDVYNALESLDKEYISGIVGAFNEAIEARKRADDAQADINKTVEQLQIAVDKMREFNKKASLEFSRLDSENWRENALKYEKELKELDEKTYQIIELLDSYKSQYLDLKTQLENYKKEKRRNTLSLKICWITTGSLAVTTITLILLIIFGVL